MNERSNCRDETEATGRVKDYQINFSWFKIVVASRPVCVCVYLCEPQQNFLFCCHQVNGNHKFTLADFIPFIFIRFFIFFYFFIFCANLPGDWFTLHCDTAFGWIEFYCFTRVYLQFCFLSNYSLIFFFLFHSNFLCPVFLHVFRCIKLQLNYKIKKTWIFIYLFINKNDFFLWLKFFL